MPAASDAQEELARPHLLLRRREKEAICPPSSQLNRLEPATRTTWGNKTHPLSMPTLRTPRLHHQTPTSYTQPRKKQNTADPGKKTASNPKHESPVSSPPCVTGLPFEEHEIGLIVGEKVFIQ